MDTGVQSVGTGEGGLSRSPEGWRGKRQDWGISKLEATAEKDGADQGPSKDRPGGSPRTPCPRGSSRRYRIGAATGDERGAG